jgi:flagellar biosynthesis protein FlhG
MKTITISSGKGGVGKSSIAVNLGFALAKVQKKTLLFDADLALANLDVMIGCQPEFTLQHVLAEEKTLAEIVYRAPHGLGLIPGASGIGMLMNSGPKRLAKFFEGLKELEAETDFLIFDTSAGLDNRVMAFMRAADEVLLIATPDPTSLTDAYATAKVLFRRQPDAKIKLVLNQVRDENEAEALFARLQAVTQSFLKKSLSYGGYVRYDVQAMQATRTRTPYLLSSQYCLASNDIMELASNLKWDTLGASSDFVERLTANAAEDISTAEAV